MLRFLGEAVAKLPLTWVWALSRALAWVWFYLLPVRRHTAITNVQRVLGNRLNNQQQELLVLRCFENLVMFALEILRFPAIDTASCLAVIQRQGFHHLDAGLSRGKGVVVVTGHLGNFDLYGFAAALLGYPVNIIYKDITFGPAAKFWHFVRTKTGIKTIPPRHSKDTIRRALGRNEIVVFIIDQHMPAHRGIVCEFFGQLASTSPAPVRFALETGAALIPAIIFRTPEPGHHHAIVEPPMILEEPHILVADNIRHNTERLNRWLEPWILKYPEQWLWVHKRWKVHDAPRGWSIPPHLQHLVRN